MPISKVNAQQFDGEVNMRHGEGKDKHGDGGFCGCEQV